MLIHNLVATGSLSYNGVNISYVTGSQTSLDGLNQFSASVNTTTGSLNETTGSLNTATGSLFTASGSFSTRVTRIEGNYATTGSNVFMGAQTVCANITSTGTIIAQTLNVQQVTSSIVYSSGSNIFGCSLTNTQQFTGSVTMTGSLTVTTAGTSPEFQVAVGGTTIGNALTDVHQVTGSLRITGSLNTAGAGCFASSIDAGSYIRNTNSTADAAVTIAADGVSHYVSATNAARTAYRNLLLNPYGCNVGVGTTTPTQGKLVVSNSGPSTIYNAETSVGVCSKWVSSDGSVVFFGTDTNHPLQFITNNANVMRITSGGNIGIGTSSPDVTGFGYTTLTIKGGTTAGYAGVLELQTTQTTTNGQNVGIIAFLDGTSRNAQIGVQRDISTSTANMMFYTNAGSGIVERMRITSGGNMLLQSGAVIGLNTSDGSDNGYLAIAGASGDGSARGGHIYLSGNERSVDAGNVVIAAGDSASGTGSPGTILFRTCASVERMRITGAGNVGIGTNNPVSYGSRTLDVNAASGLASYIVARANNNTETVELAIDGGSGYLSTKSAHPLRIRTQDVTRILITHDGYISLNSVVFGTTTAGTTRTLYIGENAGLYYIGGISSIRESKKNINPISNVDWLYNLNPVTFNYRKKDAEGNFTDEFYDEVNYGLIAEETSCVADFLVNYDQNNDGTKKMLGIEYPRLIVPLLKAIQEQQCKINILESCLGIN